MSKTHRPRRSTAPTQGRFELYPEETVPVQEFRNAFTPDGFPYHREVQFMDLVADGREVDEELQDALNPVHGMKCTEFEYNRIRVIAVLPLTDELVREAQEIGERIWNRNTTR